MKQLEISKKKESVIAQKKKKSIKPSVKSSKNLKVVEISRSEAYKRFSSNNLV